MERLTCLKTPARWDRGRHPTKYTSRSTFPEVVERLAYYEDAKQDGRLVVLPCKVGDLLYEADLPEYGVITCKVLHIGYYIGPAGHILGNPMVSAVNIGVEVIDGHGKGSSYDFETEDFGKIVFYTREEAEAALKGGAE